MKQTEAEQILERYNAGQANAAEKAMVERWYLQHRNAKNLPDPGALLEDQFRSKEKLIAYIQPKTQPKAKRNLWPRVAVAASLIIALSVGLYDYTTKENQDYLERKELLAHDVKPGGNRATLTFADGSTLDLSDDQNGIVIGEEGLTYDDGSLVRLVENVQLLTITTPKGGQYQITLADGTKVWLNAASTLKYPTHFNGTERRVELDGEAYFEVESSRQFPFTVISLDQKVTVLGTQFNINAYSDENTTKTTLLEGSVRVSASSSSFRTLIPGQQSILQNHTLSIQPANIEETMAWKNNMFVFNNKPLEVVMKMIARWYDVEIIYEDKKALDEVFGGSITRYENLSKVLGMLEKAGDVRFKLEERRLTVMK